jgi:hypothetical protein
MIGSTTITTKWNKFSDWRDADISKTDVLKSIKLPATCFLSANAWGLKGKLPGGKHSWIAEYNGYAWKTFEITDRETLEVQQANIFFCERDNYTERQLIVSDRDPSTLWFGNSPRLDAIFNWKGIEEHYPLNTNINLAFNNCNTYLSYIAWRYHFNLKLPYIGFRDKSFWEKYEIR